jgi:hypothetical protein
MMKKRELFPPSFPSRIRKPNGDGIDEKTSFFNHLHNSRVIYKYIKKELREREGGRKRNQ